MNSNIDEVIIRSMKLNDDNIYFMQKFNNLFENIICLCT